MKRPLIVIAAIAGLAVASAASAAQPETYQIDLSNGYAMVAFVGNTPAEYAKAQRLANRWEGQRHLGLGPQTIVARAIDNSEGTAKQQIRRLGVPDTDVAYVQVH